jgi:hypothetical protein
LHRVLILAMAGCASLCLAACASEDLSRQAAPEPKSTPPTEQGIDQAAKAVMAAAKLAGKAEVSELRRAMVSAPADWLVCLRSNVPPFRPYALFLKGNELVHFRLAVLYDDCAREMYMPVIDPSAPPQ